MARLFVNYRRDDDAGTAVWIASALAARFGSDRVFRDSDSIPLGSDYQQVIPRELYRADVVLAIIGPRWLNIRNPSGQRALDNPQDWVRREIAAAVSAGIPVIPVLVQGARPPTTASLPPDLHPLARSQGVRVDPRSAVADIEVLVHRLWRQFPDLRPLPLQAQAPTPPATRPDPVAIASGQSVAVGSGNRIRKVRTGNTHFKLNTIGLGILGLALVSGGTAAVIAIHNSGPSVQLSSIVGQWKLGGGDVTTFATMSDSVLTVTSDGHFRLTESLTEHLPSGFTPPSGFEQPNQPVPAGTGNEPILGAKVDCGGSVEPSGDHFVFHSTSGSCSDFTATTTQHDTIIELDNNGQTASMARVH